MRDAGKDPALEEAQRRLTEIGLEAQRESAARESGGQPGQPVLESSGQEAAVRYLEVIRDALRAYIRENQRLPDASDMDGVIRAIDQYLQDGYGRSVINNPIHGRPFVFNSKWSGRTNGLGSKSEENDWLIMDSYRGRDGRYVVLFVSGAIGRYRVK